MDSKTLKTRANRALNRAGFDPMKLAFCYFGATLLVSAILMALNYFIDMGIGSTGGLAGMGNRAVLMTAQNVLMLAQAIATPFWQAGWTLCVIAIYREEDVYPRNLLEGFRHAWRVFRLTVMEYLFTFAAMFLGAYTVFALYCATPVGTPVMEAMTRNPEDLEGIIAAMGSRGQTVGILCLVVGVALGIFMSYLLRFARILLLRNSETGIFGALIGSLKRTLKHFGRVLLLDLSFWWVWAIEGLCLTVYLLASVFTELQMWHGWVLYVAFGIGELVRLLACVLFRPKMDVAYVAAVEAMDELNHR